PFVCGQGYGACPALVTHEYAAQGQYAATLTAFVCTDTATATQQFSVVPTAVGQVAVPTYRISVLPNPASDVLHLEAVGALSPSHELQFSLYDAMGRAVRRLALRANVGSVRLGIADLPQGLYFWTFYDGPKPDRALGRGKVVVLR
ncbi:MAG: T9SS type A sorting domain-containing protein, partial [Chitinophagales bacterium]|nr:T9SS type A sorting domain-containing protein [Chitinophagales bacterium]